MGVDHPRDDEEARAVDALGVRGRLGDDATACEREIAAPELALADVDEAALEQQRRAHDARA
jgi:hypothetical protein